MDGVEYPTHDAQPARVVLRDCQLTGACCRSSVGSDWRNYTTPLFPLWPSRPPAPPVPPAELTVGAAPEAAAAPVAQAASATSTWAEAAVAAVAAPTSSRSATAPPPAAAAARPSSTRCRSTSAPARPAQFTACSTKIRRRTCTLSTIRPTKRRAPVVRARACASLHFWRFGHIVYSSLINDNRRELTITVGIVGTPKTVAPQSASDNKREPSKTSGCNSRCGRLESCRGHNH